MLDDGILFDQFAQGMNNGVNDNYLSNGANVLDRYHVSTLPTGPVRHKNKIKANDINAGQKVLEPSRNMLSNNTQQQVMPNQSPQASVASFNKEKKKSDKWKIFLLVVCSILLIGGIVLAILAALGVFKKKDEDISNNIDGSSSNSIEDNASINNNNNSIDNSEQNSNINTSDNIDGKFDAGILNDDNPVDISSSTVNSSNWDGIGKSDGLLTNGDIQYNQRFQEIVDCENSPNVTYTLWQDLNGDGICQVGEKLAAGKGFMVDGDCVIICGRKFPLNDNMQVYSKLNKLSNQELKVLNHTSTYYKDGVPHVIIDGLKTSVNIDNNHVGGSLNIEGYNVGDFYATDISKNSFAQDVVNSYLNNNSLTDGQKKLILAWSNGKKASNIDQYLEYYNMDNTQAKSNLKNTYEQSQSKSS